ncbi:Phosphoadenosine phosphosulfate reductase family protein [compost metagenome]
MVNISEYQLDLSPKGDQFHCWLADFADSKIPGACADIVMLNSALCQMQINLALSEARRILKDGGQLFVSDLALDEYREIPDLFATFMPLEQWAGVIDRHGFEECSLAAFGEFDSGHFRDAMGAERFDSEFSSAIPFIGRFTKRTIEQHIDSVIGRHDRIALQFSGGKDSLAALHMLRKHWEKLTVYWLNTGDSVPEVLEVLGKIKPIVPNFVEVHGRVTEQIAQHGLPSDLVPTSSTPFGIGAFGGGIPLQDRFNCCYFSLMKPMHDRMEADGVTLIIRGQKSADTMKAAIRSGAILGTIEFLFPAEDMTDAEVFDWLEQNAFVPAYYNELSASPDCLTCSAYWSEGRASWLKAKHPIAHASYQQKLDVIREAVMPHIELFNLEVTP